MYTNGQSNETPLSLCDVTLMRFRPYNTPQKWIRTVRCLLCFVLFVTIYPFSVGAAFGLAPNMRQTIAWNNGVCQWKKLKKYI